jgi:ABC-type phosphate/phosphonate transport system substrate-binding protein
MIARRRLLQLAGAALAQVAAWPARAAEEVRVVANSGVENQTLIELLDRQGFLRSVGISQTLVVVASPQATLETLTSDRADICVVSGFNGVLPAIEKGSPIKVVGAAQRAPALAVYSARPDIRSVSDLVGRTVGIGPELALLHVTMLALLKAKGVDAKAVRFVRVGSNAEIYREVKAGKIDAGPSDVSNLLDAERSGVHMLSDGKMWSELAEYPISSPMRPTEPSGTNVTAWCEPWRLTERCSGSCPPPIRGPRTWKPAAPCLQARRRLRALPGTSSNQRSLTPEARKRRRSASTICRRCMSRSVCRSPFCRSN